MGIETGYTCTSSIDDAQAVTNSEALFDLKSHFLQSRPFSVKAGMGVLLSGYDIPVGAELTVEGVLLGGRAMAQMTGCAPCIPGPNSLGLYTVRAADVIFRSPMKLGGNIWKLTSDIDRLLIPLQGTYILSLNDAQYEGQFQVEKMDVSISDLPYQYMAGIGVVNG